MNLLLFVFLIFVFSIKADDGLYTTKYDNINLEEILQSDRLLKNYVNCLMERGGCTPDAKELKKVLPDALNTGCSKCSDVQKNGARKVIRHLVNKKREWFEELLAKYDPDGVFKLKYQDEWVKEGLPLE